MAYIYRHIRLDTNEPFYIGLGVDNKGQYKRAHQTRSRSDFWRNIVNNHPWKIEIILDNLSIEEACNKEKEFIKLYGRRDLGLGPLVNLSDGGDGLINPSQLVKDKISKSLTGKKQSDYTKLKRVKTLKKVWESEELRQLKRDQSKELHRLGIISRKGIPSPRKGIKCSQEVKNKVSIGVKKYYSNNRSKSRIDIDIENKIVKDYINGVSVRDIASKYGINRNLMTSIAKRNNVPFRHGSKKISKDILYELIIIRKMTVEETAKYLKCSIPTVEKYKKINKIYVKNR